MSATRRTGWTFAVTSIALFMTSLDNLVMTTALPSIRNHLHASLEGLQWTVNAYTLTFTGATLGERYGRRLFVAGLGLFTVGSAAAALAPGIGTLIAARAVQGVGAAILIPLTLTLLSAASLRSRSARPKNAAACPFRAPRCRRPRLAGPPRSGGPCPAAGSGSRPQPTRARDAEHFVCAPKVGGGTYLVRRPDRRWCDAGAHDVPIRYPHHELDPGIRLQDDLFRHVNGRWLADHDPRRPGARQHVPDSG